MRVWNQSPFTAGSHIWQATNRCVAFGTTQSKHEREKRISYSPFEDSRSILWRQHSCIPVLSIYTEILSKRKIACRCAVCDLRSLFCARVHGQYNDHILKVLALYFFHKLLLIHNISNQELRHKGNTHHSLLSSSSVKNQNGKCLHHWHASADILTGTQRSPTALYQVFTVQMGAPGTGRLWRAFWIIQEVALRSSSLEHLSFITHCIIIWKNQ